MPQTSTEPRFNARLFGMICGLLAVLAVAAYLFTLDSDGDKPIESSGATASTSAGATIAEIRPVSVTGEDLAKFPGNGQSDPARGKVAPGLRGAAFDGSSLAIGPGKPKILVFLAHWCPHCQAEVPRLAAWLAENGPAEDVQILAVATSTSKDRPNYPPSVWLAREGFDVPVMADDESFAAARAYGLSSFPYFVALDSANKVVARTSGELEIDQFEALVDRARTAG